jgi:MYXO-CTERM domain-containing protein
VQRIVHEGEGSGVGAVAGGVLGGIGQWRRPR